MFSLFSGLVKYWFKRKSYNILLVGLESAGKTTFMEAAKLIFTGKEGVSKEKIAPTTGFNIATMTVQSADLTLWDLGGERGHRDIVWPNYIRDASAFIFVIDSCSDDIVFHESLQTFHALFGTEPSQRNGVPVLIVVNKQDLYGARDVANVERALDLPRHELHLAAWRIQPASAYDAVGIKEGLEWLSTYLANFVPSS